MVEGEGDRQRATLFTINAIEWHGELKFSDVPELRECERTTSAEQHLRSDGERADTDGGGLFDTASPSTVTVTNVDEAGTASFTGTLSGGSTLTASVTDPDGSISSESYQWQRGDTAIRELQCH